MPFLRRALWMAARRAAAHPKVQSKVREVLEEEVVPRVRTTVEVARPEIRQLRDKAERAGEDIKKAVSESTLARRGRDVLNGTEKPPE